MSYKAIETSNATLGVLKVRQPGSTAPGRIFGNAL